MTTTFRAKPGVVKEYPFYIQILRLVGSRT